MSYNFNLAVIEGLLVKNPEQKFSPKTSVPFMTFILANNRQKKTNYFKVVAWNTVGEKIAPYLKKGCRVIITGVINHDRWSDKEGKQHKTYSIEASKIEFVNTVQHKIEPKKDVVQTQENSN